MAFGGPSVVYADAYLKAAFGDAHTADFPSSYWLCLFLTPPIADGTLSVEPNPAHGYARVEIPNNSSNWVVPADDGTVWNSVQVNFPLATTLWGTPGWYGLSNTSTIGSGNFVAVNPISSPLAITTDLSPFFAAGDIVVTCGNLAS